MIKNLLFIVFLIPAMSFSAQEVQWASKLIKYSSQYDQPAYSAEQVLGKPDKLPGYGQSPVAWAPEKENSRFDEYLWVEFSQTIHVRQVLVAENLNPGAIREIYLYDENNRRHLVYENEHPGATFLKQRLFQHLIDRTRYRVKGCRIELATNAIPGMIQIDAIGIADHQEKVELKINEIQDLKFEGNPENLGRAVNSPYDERLPIISPDGKTLYFARKHHPQNIGDDKADDIWASQRDPMGYWTPAKNIGAPLNNEYHNYVAAISTDGRELVLANEYNIFGNPSEGVSVSLKNNDGWGKPMNLKIRSFQNLNEFSCYSMGINNKVLLMAIERKDTYGGMDIYVSFREGANAWTAPMNIGADVNTAGYEGSVFLAADMRTIYFASEGHPGYGEFDMFMSRRLDDTWTRWSEPVNMGSRINSKGWDVNYTVPASGDYVYFSSDQYGEGGTDLFRIKLPRELQPDPVAMLEGKVIDAITRKPMDVTIKYIDARTGEEIMEVDTRDQDGEYKVILPKDAEITVETQTPGYYPQTATEQPEEDRYVDFDETDEKEKVKREVEEEVRKEIEEELENRPGDDPEKNETLKERLKRQIEKRIDELLEERNEEELDEEEKEKIKEDIKKDVEKDIEEELNKEDEYEEKEQDIEMIPIEEGQVIRLDNIYFEANKWYLRSESYEELDKVVKFMNDNPGVYIEIGGHTNGLPSHAFCDELSENRASTVAEYLVEQGIPASRITSKGYGKRQPVASNDHLAGRKKNQRVEVKIIKVE